MKLITALIGAIGFALFFNVDKRHIAPAAFGGLLTWVIYWSTSSFISGIFVPCLIASTLGTLYAEIVARRCNVPASVFFIIAVIPLIPGRGLFNTMSDAVNSNWDAFAVDGLATFQFAAGIALGICLVTAGVGTVRFVLKKLHFRKAA